MHIIAFNFPASPIQTLLLRALLVANTQNPETIHTNHDCAQGCWTDTKNIQRKLTEAVGKDAAGCRASRSKPKMAEESCRVWKSMTRIPTPETEKTKILCGYIMTYLVEFHGMQHDTTNNINGTYWNVEISWRCCNGGIFMMDMEIKHPSCWSMLPWYGARKWSER